MSETLDLAAPITLHLPKRLEVGQGSAARLGPWASGYERILVIAMARSAGQVERLGLGPVTVFGGVQPEPKDSCLDAALAVARDLRPDLIVGLGGGSVMDVAKLVAVLWDSDQTLADVAGPNRVARKCSALAQVATTAGTGSEGGIRALVTSTQTGAKVAVESPHMAADIAILDPDLTLALRPDVTAATGVDALAHCVEAFTSLKAHPLVDGYARMGIALTGRFLARAVADGTDTEARAGMLLASFYGGLCLGPVNTAAGHALAYPLGTRGGLGHGLSVALLFPQVLAFNQPVRPGKTAEVMAALDLRGDVAEAASGWCRALGLDMSLAAHGIGPEVLAAWAAEAHGIRRLMDNNPRDMGVADVEGIYRRAL